MLVHLIALDVIAALSRYSIQIIFFARFTHLPESSVLIFLITSEGQLQWIKKNQEVTVISGLK